MIHWLTGPAFTNWAVGEWLGGVLVGLWFGAGGFIGAGVMYPVKRSQTGFALGLIAQFLIFLMYTF